MINLAVTADFAAHRRGDIIRDQAEIAKVLASESAACVVKIESRDPPPPAPKPAPVPAAPAQSASAKTPSEPQKSTIKDAAAAPASKSE